MPSRINIGPGGGPFVELDEENGELVIRVPEDEVNFDQSDLRNVKDLTAGSVNTEDTRVTRNAIGQSLDDAHSGPVLGANSRSHTNKFPQILNAIPGNRDKPIITLRTDRYAGDGADLFDAFASRNLPFALSVTPPELPGNSTELTSTLGKTIEMATAGCEVGLYGGEDKHLFHDIEDLDELIETLWEGKNGIENFGFNCNHFGPRGGGGFENREFGTDMAQHRAIDSLFIASGLSNMHANTGRGVAPVGKHIGPGWPIDIDTNDPTQSEVDDAKQAVDAMIQSGGPVGSRHFFHATDYTDNNSWGVFEDFLDKLETERDAGNIQVVTPTMYAWTAHNPSDYNIVVESSPQFENASDGAWISFVNYPDVGNWPSDPHWILGLDEDGNDNLSGVRVRQFDAPVYFSTLMVQFDAKAPSGETNPVEVRADDWEYRDHNDTMQEWSRRSVDLDIDHDTFETYYVPLGFPRAPDTGSGAIVIYGTSSGAKVHVKNIKIYPI